MTGVLWGSDMFGGEGIRILVGKVSRFEFILSFLLFSSLSFVAYGESFGGGDHNFSCFILFSECWVLLCFRT